MKNIIYLKTLVASVLLSTMVTSTSFAHTYYRESTTVTKDINDNWVHVDPINGSVSTAKGNVVVTVEEGVSVTADYLNVYGTGSALVFLGNKQVNIGQISIYGGAGSTGASMEFYNSTINAGSIYLREGGTSLLLKNSTVTVSGVLNITPNAKIIVDGGSIIASSFSQIGVPSKDNSGDIKVLNDGSLTLSSEDNSSNLHGHNIYVDSTSHFTSANNDSYYGSLTLEAGAEVTLAADSKTSFESITLILDYVIEDTDSELNLSGFNKVKMGEETVTFASLSENVIVQGANGDQYEMLYDETTKSYSVGEYIGTVVPEPSTYAMIFGALSLGFAMYRRRK